MKACVVDQRFSFTDPHCHLWDLRNPYYGWLSRRESELLGALAPISQTYLPEDYLADVKSVVLKKFVHIEAVSLEYAKEEVVWLDGLSKTCPQLGGVIAVIDLSLDSAETLLEFYSQYPLVKGVRQILAWHEESRYRMCDHPHWLLDPVWQKNYQLLHRYGFSFDMQVNPQQIPDVVKLAQKFPEIPMIIDHAGMPIPGEIDGWKIGILALSRCQNSAIKLSGFGMLDHVWGLASVQDQIKDVIDCFGVDRCMFASNFPVDKLYRDFDSLICVYWNSVKEYSASEKSKLFSENAERFYRLER